MSDWHGNNKTIKGVVMKSFPWCTTETTLKPPCEILEGARMARPGNFLGETEGGGMLNVTIRFFKLQEGASPGMKSNLAFPGILSVIMMTTSYTVNPCSINTIHVS